MNSTGSIKSQRETKSKTVLNTNQVFILSPTTDDIDSGLKGAALAVTAASVSESDLSVMKNDLLQVKVLLQCSN
jgi:hypothetical protein